MDKEYLWNNKEIIIKKLYVLLGVLLILYLIVNLVRINSKQSFDSNELLSNVSNTSQISSEYIPAIITYSDE